MLTYIFTYFLDTDRESLASQLNSLDLNRTKIISKYFYLIYMNYKKKEKFLSYLFYSCTDQSVNHRMIFQRIFEVKL